MKNQIMPILALTTVIAAGCSLDNALDLGPSCPGLTSIVMLESGTCQPQNPGSAECKTYIKDQAFEASRCPINFKCMQSDSSSYCYCTEPCDTTCCSDGYVCNQFYKKCEPAIPGDCTSNDDCVIQDRMTPYCVDGACVACTLDTDCKEGKHCRGNRCIDCESDADCSEGMTCSNSRCVACDDEEEPTCVGDKIIHFCSGGLIRETTCPKEAPICKDGACLSCLSDSDCKEGSYCINQHCIDCIQDSDCSAQEGTPYCRGNKCVSCASNDDCKDEADGKNICSPNGSCVECVDGKYETNCEGLVLKKCINFSVTEKTCPLACDATTEEGCVSCSKDEDCAESAAGPFCLRNECVECRDDDQDPQNTYSDCAEPKKCNPKHVCALCLSDNDCQENVDGQTYCLDTQGICVECRDDTQCAKVSGKPLCDDKTHTCIPACTEDENCSNGQQCNNGSCVDKPQEGSCFRDDHCEPLNKICDKEKGKCIGCKTNNDCKSAGRGNVCSVSNECLECTENEHCSDGKTCDKATNTCLECNTNTPECDTNGKELKTCNMTTHTWERQDCGSNGCSNGACNSCKLNEVSGCANGTQLSVCQQNGPKLEIMPKPCPSDKPYCLSGQCVECQNNNTKCENKALYQCQNGSWTLKQSCGANGCKNDSACNSCQPGTSQCNGDYLVTCVNGDPQSKYCDYGCSGNTCRSPECTGGSPFCEGNYIKTCVGGSYTTMYCDNGCLNGQCIERISYPYLRINDLSYNTGGSDPGADIDAVVHKRNGNVIGYASSVITYTSGVISSDVNSIVGSPDAFPNYPYNMSTAYSRQYSGGTGPSRYGSLGGSGNSVLLQMSNPIMSGDVIDVLEIGNCDLTQCTGNKTYYNVSADPVSITIMQSRYDSGITVQASTNSPIITFRIP